MKRPVVHVPDADELALGADTRRLELQSLGEELSVIGERQRRNDSLLRTLLFHTSFQAFDFVDRTIRSEGPDRDSLAVTACCQQRLRGMQSQTGDPASVVRTTTFQGLTAGFRESQPQRGGVLCECGLSLQAEENQP